MPNHFATNLVFLRKLFRVSQSQLASQVNKGQTTIGNWENSQSMPSADDLIIIKHFFALSMDHLIETNLADVDPIDLPTIIKKEGITDQKVDAIQKKVRRYAQFDTPPLQLNEPAQEAAEWATLKLLHQMDKKLDDIRDAIGKKR